jgi:hypothetical protein
MALTNAQKQARWRERNVIVLTADAADIAEKLMDTGDLTKLRKIHRWIGNHLKNPKRSRTERAVDLGRMGVGTARGNKSRKRVAEEAAKIDRLFATQEAEFDAVNAAYMAGEITQEEYDAYYRSNDSYSPPWLIKLRNRHGLPAL